MNLTDSSKKDCLVLSVTVSQKSKKHMRGAIETSCRDYTLAEGMDSAALYLHSPNGVEAHIRDMGADEFRDLISQEESIPQYLRPVVKLKPVDRNSRTGVYARLFLCDLGTGGAMQKVHAQSQKYKYFTR